MLCAGVEAKLGKVNIKSKEKQLVKDLLDRYEGQGKEGRPVVNTSDIVVVRFGLSLVQILDVDEKDQILKTNIWYQYVSTRGGRFPAWDGMVLGVVVVFVAGIVLDVSVSACSVCLFIRLIVFVFVYCMGTGRDGGYFIIKTFSIVRFLFCMIPVILVCYLLM